VILEYFQKYYEPIFRRGSIFYSGSLGREVKMSEATCGAPAELLSRLAQAVDAPRDRKGQLDPGSLPWFFNTWCRRPDKGRTVSRSEYEAHIDALRTRMNTAAGKELYRQRCRTVELVNADWKEHRKLRRVSGRGRGRVQCQVGLVVLAHNLLALLTGGKPTEAAGAADEKHVESIS
jgi:hypothetical protein